MKTPHLNGPEWDPDNRRFRPPERCPYPDCAQPVRPLHFLPALGWCEACTRPYEAVQQEAQQGLLRDDSTGTEVYRRPWSAFSTRTGGALRGDSLLDWNEAGGSAGRSHSPRDPLGNVFGPPRADRRFVLREGWQRSLLAAGDEAGTAEDQVVGINVVRGQVVATTARGWLGIFDARDGTPRLQRPLEWPDPSTDPTDPARAVLHAPVFRGSRMLVAAAHQAVFRDLAPYLYFRGMASEHPTTTYQPTSGCQFLGPPLGLDLPTTSLSTRDRPTGDADGVLFALLQGRPDLERQAFVDGEILLFNPAGTLLARCPATGVMRPPAFDAATGCLLWVDGGGTVSMLERAVLASLLRPDTASSPRELVPTRYTPESPLDLEPSSLPTLQVVPDPSERPEVWVSREAGGRVEMLRATLADIVRGEPWQWERRDLGELGDLMGFAIGYGSRHAQNVGGHLLAVSTDRMVAIFPRYSSAASVLQPLRGPEQRLQGAREAPLVCSAGILARFQDGLRLGAQGLGWADLGTPSRIRVPGAYDAPQGLAMLGRDVFLGQGMSVHCYRLQPEEFS